jgi:hypothetical protein
LNGRRLAVAFLGFRAGLRFAAAGRLARRDAFDALRFLDAVLADTLRRRTGFFLRVAK